MSLFRRNFHLTIILIFLYCLTFGTGYIVPKDLEHDLQELEYLPPSNNGAWNPEADKEICLAVMRKYCGHTAEWPFPTLENCIRQAVLTWREDIIPEGVLKNYYLKFIEHRGNLKAMSKYMLTPIEFCQIKPIEEFEGCQEELSNFEKKPKDALYFALFSTKIDEYCTIAKEGGTRTVVQPTKRHAFEFMLYLRNLIVIINLPHPIPNPVEYCQTTCYNPENERTPLDWTPYYHESVEDN